MAGGTDHDARRPMAPIRSSPPISRPRTAWIRFVTRCRRRRRGARGRPDDAARAVGAWLRGVPARRARAVGDSARDVRQVPGLAVPSVPDIKALNVELSDDVRAVMDRPLRPTRKSPARRSRILQAAIAASPEEAAELGMSPRVRGLRRGARSCDGRGGARSRAGTDRRMGSAGDRGIQARARTDARGGRGRSESAAGLSGDPWHCRPRRTTAASGSTSATWWSGYGENVLKRLPGPGRERKQRRYVYALTGGLSIDEAALLLASNPGDAMWQAMVNAPDRVKTIEAHDRRPHPRVLPGPADRQQHRRAGAEGRAPRRRMEVGGSRVTAAAKAAGAAVPSAYRSAPWLSGMIGWRSIRSLRPNEYLVPSGGWAGDGGAVEAAV